MTEKELRKLGRAELLELLLEQAREFEALEQRLNAAEAALQSRQLQLETCGSIAEASLKLNGVFEAAQKAAEQYQQNVERLCQEKISAAESQAQEILARAKKAANLNAQSSATGFVGNPRARKESR
mgnify:CR=1 FL=1